MLVYLSDKLRFLLETFTCFFRFEIWAENLHEHMDPRFGPSMLLRDGWVPSAAMPEYIVLSHLSWLSLSDEDGIELYRTSLAVQNMAQ